EFLKASGEARPDLAIEIWLDGQKQKEVKVDAANLFTFDNTFTLAGDVLTAGEHTLEFRKQGNGPLYFNAYQTDFTLEDPITRAGLEIKVNRTIFKLTPVKATAEVSGAKGQVVQQAVSKFDREELANLAQLKSGDLIEVELEIDSKNDYEYLVFEDMKAAGFEPVEVRSGYLGNALGAYTEFRDERVCFFVRSLPRGKHSVTYRLRAEIPGKFSALPARGSAMYAPELKANSDEIKLQIAD
ncbi:MAG TPA: alpha-2-macroglobulin, partial [Planctomycetaceae bacterium]|nr:alpha-2-macroglobulin [Planctomycetaceae bacterium]